MLVAGIGQTEVGKYGFHLVQFTKKRHSLTISKSIFLNIKNMNDSKLNTGATLMTLAGIAFVGYGIVFFLLNFFSSGFELGVDTLNGTTQADLNALNPAIAPYIAHLHVAAAGFIVGTGIAVASLSHFAVRRGEMWAWVTAVAAPVVALAAALPMHYLGQFEHNWVLHLGPIYLGTGVFVIGALMALMPMMAKES